MGMPFTVVLEDADIFAVRPRAQTMEHGFRLAAGERGNPVVSLHTAKRGVVARLAEGVGGEIAILHLGFLQA